MSHKHISASEQSREIEPTNFQQVLFTACLPNAERLVNELEEVKILVGGQSSIEEDIEKCFKFLKIVEKIKSSEILCQKYYLGYFINYVMKKLILQTSFKSQNTS